MILISAFSLQIQLFSSVSRLSALINPDLSKLVTLTVFSDDAFSGESTQFIISIFNVCFVFSRLRLGIGNFLIPIG